MSQGKYWCFTSWDMDKDPLNWEGYSYLIRGVERCPETGKLHYQGYVEFTTNWRLNRLKKLDERAHFETRKGKQEDAIKYCKKEECWMESGVKAESNQGKRTDLEIARELVKDGGNMRDVVESVSGFQAIRAAEKYLQYKEAKRTWKPTVNWYYGPTGSGKTRRALKEAGEDVWVSGKNLKWWEGYDGHESVVIDDFRGDFCTFHELLRILDRYEYRIEVKGGSRQLLAKTIWITSPFRPEEVYKTREDVEQLLRRIDNILGFEMGLESGGNTRPPSKPSYVNIKIGPKKCP